MQNQIKNFSSTIQNFIPSNALNAFIRDLKKSSNSNRSTSNGLAIIFFFFYSLFFSSPHPPSLSISLSRSVSVLSTLLSPIQNSPFYLFLYNFVSKNKMLESLIILLHMNSSPITTTTTNQPPYYTTSTNIDIESTKQQNIGLWTFLDKECNNDIECPNEKACLQNICADPCSLRDACGRNALCKTALHRPRCACPSCYIGNANVECKPDPQCDASTSPRPNDLRFTCSSDADCHESNACSSFGQCIDPCDPTHFTCEPNKRCETRRHRPVCVCKFGFVVNEYGELICAPDKRECTHDNDCAANMACIDAKCQNPCATDARNSPCPADKSCQVQNHRAICICMNECSPSVSICLRDSGCAAGLACRNYQCINPCVNASCAANSPCFVEDHKPICKFCPPGFVADAKTGCQKGKT